MVSAIISSLPPRDGTVRVRHFLAASAAWLSHMWFNPLDNTYRQIITDLQLAYRNSINGNLDPWDTLRTPSRLALFPEALLCAWADLTCRPAIRLDIPLEGHWVIRLQGDIMAGVGMQGPSGATGHAVAGHDPGPPRGMSLRNILAHHSCPP